MSLDSHAALTDRFERLTALLHTRRPLWEPRPFVALPAPWEAELPSAASWLRARSTEQSDALDQRREAAWDSAPGELQRLLAEAAALCTVPSVAGSDVALPRELSRRIPGRKWRQLRAFTTAAVPVLDGLAHCPDLQIVDWCAGKGHLGRTLARVSRVPAVCLERQSGLCASGRELAAEWQAPVAFIETDVHEPTAWTALGESSVAVGLHACGALTDRLIREATARGVRALLSVPCCHHHLGGRRAHAPLSSAGREADLPLPYGALRLPTLGEFSATATARRRRRQEQSWRLGLDLLLREASGDDTYTPLGPLPTALWAGSFERFCRHVAADRELALPAHWNPSRAEREGREQARVVAGLGIVRGLYRRPLELWLVLDRALHVAEAGRQVEVRRFCDAGLTPRNLMIRSVRR